jgi:cytochrome c5
MGIRLSARPLTLGVLLLSGASVVASELNLQTGSNRTDGATIFLKYCAGCHGFDGFAAYSAAPSFSMGDRLHKSDSELLQSVLHGKGAMPSWEDKLPVSMLVSAIQYLRLMNRRIKSGQPPRKDKLPEYYFRFRPAGETNTHWWLLQVE